MTCSKPLKRYSRSERGFTLIEVLVALTIMAMIMAVAFAGLSIGIDSWHRGSRKIDELDGRFALERLVQRQVALADPHMFQGTGQKLEFISTYSFENGASDPVKVNYVSNSGKFMYSETPAAADVQDGSAASAQTLGSFSRLAFRYLSQDAQGRRAWVDQWTDEMELPVAVRFQIGDDVLTIPLVNRQ